MITLDWIAAETEPFTDQGPKYVIIFTYQISRVTRQQPDR